MLILSFGEEHLEFIGASSGKAVRSRVSAVTAAAVVLSPCSHSLTALDTDVLCVPGRGHWKHFTSLSLTSVGY